MKIGKYSSISLNCNLSSPLNISIGNNTVINQECYLDGRGILQIGNNVNIGRRVSIYTAQHNSDSSQFEYVQKSIIINDNVWIASNVVIIPGVIIGKGAVIGAGSVVTKNIEEFVFVAGNPAKKVKARPKNINYKTNWARLFY